MFKPMATAWKANPTYIEDFRQRKPLGRLGDVMEASRDCVFWGAGEGCGAQHPKTSEACIAKVQSRLFFPFRHSSSMRQAVETLRLDAMP